MEKGKAGENYHICGPVVSFEEAMKLCEKITGIKPPSMQASPGMLRAMASLMGVVGKIIPLPESYHEESLRVIAGITYTGTEEGLRETLEYEMKKLGMNM